MSEPSSPYLYARGPWPQPDPLRPHDVAPTVLHLPREEREEWDRHIGARYRKQVVLESLPAARWARQHTGVKLVSDARFVEILADGIFSKFLTPPVDEYDLALFEARVPDVRQEGRYFKADYTVVRAIRPKDGVSVAPTIVLFRVLSRHRYEVASISVDRVVFLPGDGDGWSLAKVFALQAGGIATTLYMHPMVHFPTDAMNAIVKTLLPRGHDLQRLFLPHFYLALGMADAVLHDADTVMNTTRFYSPYPGALEEHWEAVAATWSGMKRPDRSPNSAYPEYSFKLGPREVHSPYGDFLARYYQTLRAFGLEVALRLEQDTARSELARHLSFWIRGFPGPAEFAEPEVFAEVFATVVSDVAIGHTADHALFGAVDIQEVPMRVRAPIPHAVEVDPFDPSKLTKWKDAFSYRMCMKMFFAAHPITRLADIDYQFTDPELIAANVRFRAALAETERGILRDGIRNSVPLRDIAPSVQF
jgi:hypothetical protein